MILRDGCHIIAFQVHMPGFMRIQKPDEMSYTKRCQNAALNGRYQYVQSTRAQLLIDINGSSARGRPNVQPVVLEALKGLDHCHILRNIDDCFSDVLTERQIYSETIMHTD
jgi:hypothetical protein